MKPLPLCPAAHDQSANGSAEKRHSSLDETTALVAAVLALSTPTECRNHIRHCGYRLTVLKSLVECLSMLGQRTLLEALTELEIRENAKRQVRNPNRR